jgi:hypothetical protein
MSDRPTSMAHSTASRLSKRHSFRLKHTLANPQLSRSGAAAAVATGTAGTTAAVSTTGSILQQLEGSSSSSSHHAPSGTGGSAAGAGAVRQGGGSSVATSTPAAVLAAAGDPLAQYRGLALLQRPTLRECVQPCRETLLAEVDLCHKHARRIGGRLKVRPLQAYNLLTKDVSKRVYVVVRTHLQQV